MLGKWSHRRLMKDQLIDAWKRFALSTNVKLSTGKSIVSLSGSINGNAKADILVAGFDYWS